ncbi:MAG: hypothetical protein FD165_702 [Gammaproteobacteria bacterium]|nr:MAG: hypothetical protein FD165_702 [Gammaproteobacteria bacterium]TND07029.1 MAG: hypothetical protein FD120_197 [Gammaproteobacteria bacterium]
MLLISSILIIIMAERVGRCLTQWSEYKPGNFIANFEVGLSYGILVFYLLGMSPYNSRGWAGLVIYLLPLTRLAIVRYHALYMPEKASFTGSAAIYLQRNYLVLCVGLLSALAAGMAGHINLELRGDAFFSWGTWASHWASRDTLAEYKFSYPQNMPILMSMLMRLFDTTSILSPATLVYKLIMVQYLSFSVLRVANLAWANRPYNKRYAIFYIIGMSSFVLSVVVLGFVDKLSSGLPDTITGMMAFGMAMNIYRLQSQPVATFLYVFGLANIKALALPFFLTLSVVLLWQSVKNGWRCSAMVALAVVLAIAPYAIDHYKDRGQESTRDNHELNVTLTGLGGAAQQNLEAKKQQVFEVKESWKPGTEQENQTYLRRESDKNLFYSEQLSSKGMPGNIYISPKLLFLDYRFVVLYQEFKSDIAIYVILIFLIYVTVIFPIFSIPVWAGIFLWWKYLFYGFYNLDGVLLFALLLGAYGIFGKADSSYYSRSFFICFLVLGLVGMYGDNKEEEHDNFDFINNVKFLSISPGEITTAYSRSVTEEVGVSELYFSLKQRYPELEIYIPVPFERFDGRFRSSEKYRFGELPPDADFIAFHPKKWVPDSLRLDGIGLAFSDRMYDLLPEAHSSAIDMRCLNATTALAEQEKLGDVQRAYELPALCLKNPTNGRILVDCPDIKYHQNNFRSPINGNFLSTIDLMGGEADWWEMGSKNDSSIEVFVDDDVRQNYSLILSAINSAEIQYQSGKRVIKETGWPASMEVGELENRFKLSVFSENVTLPRLIATVVPKNRELYAASCGMSWSRNMCVIKGAEVTRLCKLSVE